MGLSKAFSSLAGSSIKLGRLPTLPTTEDLLFVLDTATKNKKPTELPFKNPHNNITFNIKVAPATTQHAPLWTFTRLSESGTVILWTRESNVVSMIQGQVKIGSNSTGLIEEENTELEAQELSGSQPYVLGSASESACDLATADEAQGAGDQDVAGPDSTWQDAAEPDEQASYAADPYAAEPDAAWQNVTGNDASWQKAEAPDVEWHGTPEHEAAWQKPADPDAAWQNTPEHEAAWHKAAEPDAARPKAPEPDAAWQNTPEHEASWQKAAQPDAARHSRPEHEAAPPNEAGQETAWQDSAAQDLARLDVSLQKAAAQEATRKLPTGKKAKGKKAKARAAAARAAAAQDHAETASAEPNTAEPDSPQLDTAEPDTPQLDTAEPDTPQLDTAPPDMQQPDIQQKDRQKQDTQKQETSEQSRPSPIETQDQARFQHDPYHGPAIVPPPVVLHPEVLANYLSSLSDPATGLLNHGAFEFFLLRDVEYVQKRGTKMSLIVFDFVDPGTKESAIKSTEAAAVVARIMTESCTPLELCTQLRSGEFAILLCGYDGAGALNFAAKLCGRLPNGKNELSILATREPLAMGVACIPEHCEDPGSLIAAAIEAKNLARKSQRSCVLFPLF